MIGLKVRYYLKHVYLNVFIVSIISCILPLIIAMNLSENALSFIVVTAVALINTVIVELYIGCSKEERLMIYSQVGKFMKRIRRND